MAHASPQDIEVLGPAWRELEIRAPVKLRAIANERHYRAMIDFMNELLDEIGMSSPSHHMAL
jgi:HTH-type transcriptional regulator / antitoxin HigA